MAKKVKRSVKTKRSSARPASFRGHRNLSPVMQVGVVFVIVAAMLLLMFAARQMP